MNTPSYNPRGIPDDLACLAAPNPTPHTTAEPEAPFPTVAYISLTTVMIVIALLNNSLVMLVSALLPTPLLLWRLFVTLDEWEMRRAAAMKRTEATSTLNSAESPPTTAADPQPTSI